MGGLTEITDQFNHVLWKRIRRFHVPPQRPRGGHIGARCASQAQINPPRIQRRQRPELFRNDQRRVVWQHHTPCPHPDRLGPARHMPDHHRRCRRSDPRHVMMLCQPKPVKSQPFGVPRQIKRVGKRIGSGEAFGNGA